MDEDEAVGRTEYEVVENIIGVLQSHKNLSVNLATLKYIVSTSAPNTSFFMKSKLNEEWVTLIKKFPEIFTLRNDVVSFSKYFINSNPFLKKCLTSSKSPRSSISPQGEKRNDELEACATIFFQEILNKVGKMHYEKLFELLCTRSEKLLSSYFLEYSLTEMYTFFKSRENIFTISQSCISLASRSIFQNLKKQSNDFKIIHHKLQSGVILLLNHFSPLHYTESMQCLSYVFDDIKGYLSNFSSLEHRALFANFPHLAMDECGFLSVKSLDMKELSIFSDFATVESKVVLLLVTLLAFNGEIHFQKLIKVIKGFDPDFFHGISVSQQFSFFRNHDFFCIYDDGYVSLLPDFVFQSFSSTSRNSPNGALTAWDGNVTKTSVMQSLKQKGTVAMNSKGMITKTIVNDKTEKQLSWSSSALSNGHNSAVLTSNCIVNKISHASITESLTQKVTVTVNSKDMIMETIINEQTEGHLSRSSSPALSNDHNSAVTTSGCSLSEMSNTSLPKALKQDGLVNMNSKDIIANKILFSEKTKKQLSDLLKQNSMFNAHSHPVSNYRQSKTCATAKSVSVKQRQNIAPTSQSEEISICQLGNCAEKEKASKTVKAKRKRRHSSAKKLSRLEKEIVSNCVLQSSATRSMNLCPADRDKSQSLNSPHPIDVDAVIKKLVDSESVNTDNSPLNPFATKVIDSVLYLSKYFTLTDHIFVMKSLLQVLDDVRDHFFQLDIIVQHNVIKSCKRFIDEDLISYAGSTNVSCITYREQYLLFISYVLSKYTRLHVSEIFHMIEYSHTTFPVHLFTDAHKLKYFQCLKKYFFVDNEGYVELNIFPEVFALSAELYCLIAPDLLKKIKNYKIDPAVQAEIQSEIQQLKSNEVLGHLQESAISNTVDICFIVLTISKKMYFKSLYCCLSHYGIPETREYFKTLYVTEGCNVFQNIPTLFDVKCNYVRVKENVLIPYILLRETYLSEIMQQIHFFHTGYKNKHLTFDMPYVSSDLASFIEHLSNKDYLFSFLANNLNSPKKKANVMHSNEGEKTQVEESIRNNCLVDGLFQFAESAENCGKNIASGRDSKAEVGKVHPNVQHAISSMASEKILTCSEVEAKLRSEAEKNITVAKQNIVKNIVLRPPPVSFLGNYSHVKEKVEALCSVAKWNMGEGAKAEENDASDQHENSSLPAATKHGEIQEVKTEVSSKLPLNVSNNLNLTTCSNLKKQPENEVINIDDEKLDHNLTASKCNSSSLNEFSAFCAEELLPDEVMSGERSYEEYCSALVDSVLGETSYIEKEDNFGGAKPKKGKNNSLNVSPEAYASASTVSGLNTENYCTTMKRLKYFGASDSDSGYELRNTIEERAVNFFIVVLGSYDVGVPSSFARKHLSLASCEVKRYMKELYADDILPFFWKHKQIFYVSPHSQLIYLIKSYNASP